MIRFILVVSIVVFLFGCSDSNRWLSMSTAVENSKWAKEGALKMTFEVSDTIRLFDFIVDIRHDDRYKYSNLYLFVDMSFPNGKVSSDTLELNLSDASGEWLGTGAGSLYEVGFKFKDRKKFPLSGVYNVSIRHGMREEEIEGITDVGLRINYSI
jgi:gliding motility-associated lipoprotein GldH